ncbi:MAG: transporter substrate-binding domain-containing protein [Synergistaceae bacterium]|nr:transporter substrate-binding domain-containing protein [Synergistaceae bacterium]
MSARFKIAFYVAFSVFCFAAAAALVFPFFPTRVREENDVFAPARSFREVPGVTREEIQRIEKVLAKKKTFVYGMILSAECFYRKDGGSVKVSGYTALLCKWLSDLFGAPFEPRIYAWTELAKGLVSGDVDFSGDFAPLSAQARGAIMTDAISKRAIKSARLNDSLPIELLGRGREVRYGFFTNSTAQTLAAPYLSGYSERGYTIVECDNRQEALDKLRGGEIDIFIADSSLIDWLSLYSDISTSQFAPPIFNQAALSTNNWSLQPFISIINKYIASGALRQLNDLYRQGLDEFKQVAFFKSLNNEEREYYYQFFNKKPIPFTLSATAYPIQFYNKNEEKWDGVAVEILNEISRLTGLTFQPVNSPNVNWPEVYAMLESGKAPMAAELIHVASREAKFLWAKKPYATDRYALVSRNDFENVSLNQVLFSRVGLLKGSGYAEKFREWFPAHPSAREYNNHHEAIDALERGDIDLLMTMQDRFLTAINFMERSGFKVNLLFDYPAFSSFAFSLNEPTLRNLIDKAQAFVDTDGIANSWMRRTFDYQAKIAQTQIRYMTGVFALLLVILGLLAVLLLQRFQVTRRLEALVRKRTWELEEQTRATRAASEAKSDFLANMSHEMRTPMNAIVGFSELMLDSGEARGYIRDSLKKVHSSAMTLLSIINDILDISKIESGRFEIIPVNYDLPSLINDTVTLNTARVGEKPIDFFLSIDDALPCRLFGDDLRIKQICNNLLSNAFKYTKQGSVTWRLACERDGDDVWMTIGVKDTGIGIRLEDRDKLFENYSQVDTRSNRQIMGTGLGLALTKRMVEMMDGSITVESEYGKGSKFTARIRQKFVTDAPIGPELVESLRRFRYADNKLGSKLNRLQLPYARVLLVDDIPSNLDVAKGMLKPYGMKVDCVTSGAKAVELVRRAEVKYSAIFMDHMMPEMDGVETTRVIREEIGTDYARNMPIIVLTANAVVGNEEMFLSKGFQAFLSKPIDIMRLDSVIRQWVRNKEAEEKIQEGEFEDGESSEEKEILNSLVKNWRIDGIDLKGAFARFDNDAKTFLSVLRSYVKNTPPLLERLRAVTRETLPDYAILVHGLKGGSRGICAPDVAMKAEVLERAAKTGDFEFVEARGGDFIEASEKLVDGLSEILTSAKEALPRRKKARPDRNTLDALLEACRQFDIDKADMAMEDLEAYEYESEADLVHWLRETLDVMGFKKIAERLRETSGASSD